MHRRQFLQRSALLGTAAWAGVLGGGCSTGARNRALAPRVKSFELEEMTVAELQRGMASGRFTAAGLVECYRRRIGEVDRSGPRLQAVIELNPDAPALAGELDREAFLGEMAIVRQHLGDAQRSERDHRPAVRRSHSIL